MYKTFGIIFFALSVFIGFTIWHVTDEDRITYQGLLASSAPTEKPLISYSEQMREGVIKEFWYQDSSPLYVRVQSDDSELFFFHQEEQFEVVEQLETVSCVMQEQLYYENEKPMQIARYMEAKQACYNYNTQLFVAQEVHLRKYRLEGHEPVLMVNDVEPLMKGTAQSVEFTMERKKMEFLAHYLSAQFNPNETIVEANEAYYNGDTLTLTGDVKVKNAIGVVKSNNAILIGNQSQGSIQPTKVTLHSNVQMSNEKTDQYALADIVTYYPDEQLMILEGRENRVLFFDKQRNMQLSAPSVHAGRSLETNKDTIQGIGDVRFIFAQDEMSKLKERFKW